LACHDDTRRAASTVDSKWAALSQVDLDWPSDPVSARWKMQHAIAIGNGVFNRFCIVRYSIAHSSKA
jgi:hypothetical protein